MEGGKTLHNIGEGKKTLEILGPPPEVEVFVEVGYDNERRRQCPTGKNRDGRRIVFRREHHNFLRPGEVWLCNILEDRQNCLIVAPFKRLQASPLEQVKEQKATMERIAPEVATTIVNALEDKMTKLKMREEELKGPVSTLKKEYAGLQTELNEIQEEMKVKSSEISESEDELREIMGQITMFQKSLEKFGMMSVPDDVCIEDIEKKAGIYGVPDYWGDKTEHGKEPFVEGDKQDGGGEDQDQK